MRRRRGCVRVVQTRSKRLWLRWLVVGLGVGSIASGCATAVDTLETVDEVAGAGGSTSSTDGGKTSTSGKPTSGGSKSSGGSSGSGGTLTGAFGGTATTGGKSTGGSPTAGAGGKSSGGNAGTTSGGNAGSASGGNAGSGGKSTGGSANGGSGGGGSANGGTGGTGTPLACLMSWKGDKCDTCSSQTQSDKLACADILNCYAANACGPSSCGGNTDKCGANNIGKGTAGYPIAQTVYDCLCK